MNVNYVSILVVVLVLSSGVPLASGSIANYAYARYATNTQTMANNNECNNDANCSNPSSQSIGDGSANSPVNTQLSEFNNEEEQGDGVGVGVGAATLLLQDCKISGGIAECFAPRLNTQVTCEFSLGICYYRPLLIQSRCDFPKPTTEPQTIVCRR
jgi:hypothetical protein